MNKLLTVKEKNILKLVSKGLSNKDISKSEYISVETVKWHLKNVYRKLSVNCRTQAVEKAINTYSSSNDQAKASKEIGRLALPNDLH